MTSVALLHNVSRLRHHSDRSWRLPMDAKKESEAVCVCACVRVFVCTQVQAAAKSPVLRRPLFSQPQAEMEWSSGRSKAQCSTWLTETTGTSEAAREMKEETEGRQQLKVRERWGGEDEWEANLGWSVFVSHVHHKSSSCHFCDLGVRGVGRLEGRGSFTFKWDNFLINRCLFFLLSPLQI